MELIAEKKVDLKQKLDDMNAILIEIDTLEDNCQKILTELTDFTGIKHDFSI